MMIQDMTAMTVNSQMTSNWVDYVYVYELEFSDKIFSVPSIKIVIMSRIVYIADTAVYLLIIMI